MQRTLLPILKTLFAFLLESQSASDWLPQHDRCLRVCWSLDATVAPILKLLGERLCQKLSTAHKCYKAPFDIFYVPGKIFSVTHIPSHARTSLYDLAQYFPELDEPADLLEVQMLGEKLDYELKKMGMETDTLTSPVKIYEQCVMQYLKDKLPKLKDMPAEVAEAAYRCSGRLWVEAHILGQWDSAVDYDLASSFPRIAGELEDFRYCQWVQSKEYKPAAIYGYARCQVTIYDWVKISPIIRRDEDGNLISPCGVFEDYFTKGELDFIKQWGIGEFKILDGWWALIKPRIKNLPKPLAEPMGRILKYKMMGGLQAALAKRMSVGSMYGKFGEERGEEFGPYFNPVFFSEISTRVRLQVAEFLYANGIGPRESNRLLHVSVDGVLLDSELKRMKTPSGKWRLSGIMPALVVSSGLVFYGDKKPKGLCYDDVMAMIKEHPRVGYYEKKLKRRVTMADALAQGKFDDIGKTVEMVSSIDFIKLQHDRVFTKIPKTGGALLENKYRSEPIEV